MVVSITLPNTISKEQFFLLNYTIDEIGKYNREVEDRQKVEIVVFNHTCISSKDVNDIKKGLASIPIRNTMIEKEEIIVGKTIGSITSYLDSLHQQKTDSESSVVQEVEPNKSL